MERQIELKECLELQTFSVQEREIAENVLAGKRIDSGEALFLFESNNLPFLGMLATHVRRQKNNDFVYFNRNFHIEPTNLCVFDCKFCSYSRMLKHKDEGWLLSEAQMLNIVDSYIGKSVTEVHIVGGVHPKMGLEYFSGLLTEIKKRIPGIHIKGFTAVELEYMIRKAKMTYVEGLQFLKEHGLDSLPGGGAEIFDEEVRKEICEDKCTSEQWLAIHEAAHSIGMPSNATMLYGHIENYKHRIDHMTRLRDLQDRTRGFNTFIPLKFRNQENQMAHIPEVPIIEDMKMYAIARIFMDNFNHIKAYWPMLGRVSTQMTLAFGVDDIDGTIDDSTKIYSMAGSEEQNPSMSTLELIDLVESANFTAAERDTLYNVIHDYSKEEYITDSLDSAKV